MNRWWFQRWDDSICPFGAEIGVTQGYLFSLTIFNIVVDAVVRVGLLEFYGTQEAHHGLVWAALDHNIVFYVDNGRIVGCNPIWIHKTLMALVKMFERV